MENLERNESKFKGKLVKFAGVTLLTGALAISGFEIYDSTIDHTQEICPLVSILGIEHQLNAINTDSNNFMNGIQAQYKSLYTVPEGYALVGNKGIKKTTEGIQTIKATNHGEAIFITKSDVIYPEDMVNENNLSYGETETIKVLKLK